MTTIELSQIEKQFVPGTTAVRVASLRLESGQFVSLVGPSGCGKSTLLRMVAGLDRPTQGEINLSDTPDQGPRPIERAFVFQDPTLVPWRTAWENARLPLELRARLTPADMQTIEAALRLVGLTDEDFRKFPRMLSGGMRMRVSLARALVTRPNILLLDEPFAALDDLLRNQLNDQLLEIWGQQKWTGLFVTHNVPEAVYLSQRILVMQSRPGRIEADLAVPFAYPREPHLRTTSEFAAFCGEVIGRLAGGGPADGLET